MKKFAPFLLGLLFVLPSVTHADTLTQDQRDAILSQIYALEMQLLSSLEATLAQEEAQLAAQQKSIDTVATNTSTIIANQNNPVVLTPIVTTTPTPPLGNTGVPDPTGSIDYDGQFVYTGSQEIKDSSAIEYLSVCALTSPKTCDNSTIQGGQFLDDNLVGSNYVEHFSLSNALSSLLATSTDTQITVEIKTSQASFARTLQFNSSGNKVSLTQ